MLSVQPSRRLNPDIIVSPRGDSCCAGGRRTAERGGHMSATRPAGLFSVAGHFRCELPGPAGPLQEVYDQQLSQPRRRAALRTERGDLLGRLKTVSLQRSPRPFDGGIISGGRRDRQRCPAFIISQRLYVIVYDRLISAIHPSCTSVYTDPRSFTRQLVP